MHWWHWARKSTTLRAPSKLQPQTCISTSRPLSGNASNSQMRILRDVCHRSMSWRCFGDRLPAEGGLTGGSTGRTALGLEALVKQL